MDAFIKRQPKEDTPYHDNGWTSSRMENTQRPSKRGRREDVPDSQSESELSSVEDHYKFRASTGAVAEEVLVSPGMTRPTDVENALPATQDEDEAVKEYEKIKHGQISLSKGDETEEPRALYRSSIYVDAFNLALDTVLDQESHLFDEKEKEVFYQWKYLDYEAQYLYVRLFLRKTDTWHRSSRLGYYSDISDLEKAINSLKKLRLLPQNASSVNEGPLSGVKIVNSILGETFIFADASEDHMQSIEEAAPLLNLDELKTLAKDAKVQGRNKAEIIRAVCRMSHQQSSLMSLGLSRHNGRESTGSLDSDTQPLRSVAKFRREDSNREHHFLTKILAILGPCVRLSPLTHKLFERVHLVFYRSTEWTEKSLTTIILAKIARRNFPEYVVCRTSTIFDSRLHLLEFETAIKLESEIDRIAEFGELPGEEGLERIIEVFHIVYPRWKQLVVQEEEKEKKIYEMGEGAYLRRFTPAHSYTRIIHKALAIFAKRKEHAKEHKILVQLLNQKLFHMARRGHWYQRKALLEEHYMPALDESPISQDLEQQKKHWKRIAITTCETGLQDPECHLIYHWDLQKRLTKLEKKLRIPKRLQHDFGHVHLTDPIEIAVEGIQIKRDLAVKPGRQQATTKTIWLDELGSSGECSVEEMCLSHFRSNGWKGYHAEGGIVRTIFAYLFYDILFLYVPNVFQTAYQTCPLDLHTDAFYPVRASEINHRLVEIANGRGVHIVREVWEREQERHTSVVGLNWDFDIEDIAELVSCFEGSALSAICKVMAQEYKQRGGGIPDLVLWRKSEKTESGGKTGGQGEASGEVMFAEVKSANDRLSDTQRLWIHVLTGAGVKVSLCNAVAKEVREVD